MNLAQAVMVKQNSTTPLVVKLRGSEYATDQLINVLTDQQKAAMHVAHELYSAFRFSKKPLTWGAIQFHIHGVTESHIQALQLAEQLRQLGLLRWMGCDGEYGMYAISDKGLALVESSR